MPLASRATQARAARQGADTADTKTDGAPESTQPRRPSTAASASGSTKKTKPTAPETAQDTAASQESTADQPGGDAEQTSAQEPPRRGRRGPDRAPRQRRLVATFTPTSGGGEILDRSAIRERMKAIEAEAKELTREHAAALRDFEAKFAERRRTLQDEHRALSAQLSDAVFAGG